MYVLLQELLVLLHQLWGVVPWATTTDNTVTWTAIPKELIDDDYSSADWQYIQGITGGTVTAQERITLAQTVTLASVGLTTGSWIRGKLKVATLDSNFANFMLSIRSGATINGLFAFCADGGKTLFLTSTSQPINSLVGEMVTPWWKIPAGQTQLKFYLEAGAGTGFENSTMRFLATDAVLEADDFL